MNKQQLAAKIWASANKMRSKIEANDYKDYILGFIFYKYLSDNEVNHMLSLGATTEDLEDALVESDQQIVDSLRNEIGYFISYENLYSTWLSKGKDFDISNVSDALQAFSRHIGDNHKDVFEKIFDTLQTGLSKLGENSTTRTKAVLELLELIKDIPTDGKQGYDVLGFIYEYLLENFAANAGKKAGEFYTPHEVSLLLSEIVADHLKDQDTIRIYDPTSGSGSLLLNIGTSIARLRGDTDKIAYYAQELKLNTYNLTRMNLVMRGVKPANIFARNADTLAEDWPLENDPLYVDAVVSNPPYSAPWDPESHTSDARYAKFGIAPKSKADYAFVLHDLFHLRPNGIVTVVLPHGVLFRGGEEGKIRQALIEGNYIDAIIGLPANIFFGTGIPTIVMVLKKQRTETDVLIVDASKGFEKVGKDNALRARDVRKIADTVIGRKNIDKFSRNVPRDEIRGHEYNLNIPRYVDSSVPAENWDLYASMFGGIPEYEIDELNAFWEALPGLREKLFTSQGNGYALAIEGDLAEVLAADSSVAAFKQSFDTAFAGLDEQLISGIVDGRSTAQVVGGETAIAADIFARLERVDLVDEYAAFQHLHEQWLTISNDLEMIQTEGESAIRRVDPRMIIKKVKKVDTEVQDGWDSRILPYELVQEHVLHAETAALRKAEEDLAAAVSGLEELVESLSEEDKLELDGALNADSTAFVAAGVTRAVKEARKERKDTEWEEGSLQEIVISAQALLAAKTALTKTVKADAAALEEMTKPTIENLSDAQVRELLTLKWVTPLIENLEALPVGVLEDLKSRVTALVKKYQTTYADLEQNIASTSASLSGMMSQLVGSDTDAKALNELQALLGGE